MDLTPKPAMPGDAAAKAEDSPMTAELAQAATARMFRSIRAGRSWMRAQQSAPAAPQFAACIRMKPGNDDPPLFMLPGGPGSVLQLGPMAAALRVPMPVYAIKPRGLEEGEIPSQSIAEMAEYSLDVIRAVRPHGPYLFLGYSVGGLLALEMAQRLTAAGHEVPLVVLLDTYPSRQTWPLLCHAEIVARQSLKALSSLRRYAPSQIIGELCRRLRYLCGYLAESGVKFLPANEFIVEGTSAASRRVYTATYNAGEAYRPSRYAGSVLFVQPREIANLEPRSPAQVWRRLLTDLEIRRVPGSHLGMVESEAAAIAAEVGECLLKALRAPRSSLGSLDDANRPRRPDSGWEALQPSMESK
jgi:pyochelin synthetase